MPKLVGSLIKIDFNINTARRELNKKFENILIEGTKEWINTVRDNIPSWSGMSLSALRPAADLVGIPLFIRVAAGAPDRRQLGEGLGSAELTTDRFSYRFVWTSKVFHFAINEFQDATKFGFRLKQPGPYKSQEKAQQAFFRVITNELEILSFDLKSHFKVTKEILR